MKFKKFQTRVNTVHPSASIIWVSSKKHNFLTESNPIYNRLESNNSAAEKEVYLESEIGLKKWQELVN